MRPGGRTSQPATPSGATDVDRGWLHCVVVAHAVPLLAGGARPATSRGTSRCGRPQASSRICRVSTMADSPPIAEATVRVDCAISQGPIRRIWTSFGYDEINWTYTPAGKRALRTIGELRRAAVLRPLPLHLQQRHRLVACRTGERQRLPRGRRRPPFYDFTIAGPGVRRRRGGGAAAPGGAGLHAARARSRRRGARFRYEPSPTQWSPYEAGLWSFPPKDYAKWGGLVRALGRALRGPLRRRRRPRAGCGSCGTSPTSPTGAARRKNSTRCTT